jgi:hypothetical protein
MKSIFLSFTIFIFLSVQVITPQKLSSEYVLFILFMYTKKNQVIMMVITVGLSSSLLSCDVFELR